MLRRWGLTKGDRLAILSENRFEWAAVDFACLLLGVVVVPIYSTLTAQQTAYILRDSGAKVVVVSTEKQLEKVLSIRNQTAVGKSGGDGSGEDCRRYAHTTANVRRSH